MRNIDYCINFWPTKNPDEFAAMQISSFFAIILKVGFSFEVKAMVIVARLVIVTKVFVR